MNGDEGLALTGEAQPAVSATTGTSDGRTVHRSAAAAEIQNAGGSGAGRDGSHLRSGDGPSAREKEDVALAAAAKSSKKSMDPAVLLTDDQRAVQT